MKNNNNWVKISRQLLTWQWYEDIKVFKLFIHLVLECNYTEKQWQGINVCRGQLISGRKKLSAKTGLTEQEVRTAEVKLQSTNVITKVRVNNYSLYTVVNYDKWQGGNEDKDTIATNETTNETTNNQPQLKKEKKERIYINTSTTTKEKLESNSILIDNLCKKYKLEKEYVLNFIKEFIERNKEDQKVWKDDTDLYKHFKSSLAIKLKKQKPKEVVNLTEDFEKNLKWFIMLFNTISRRNYKITEQLKKNFGKQFDIGFTGDDYKTAIGNLYSSSPMNKFHIDSGFKFATPQYLLKDDNLNKYMNLKYENRSVQNLSSMPQMKKII